MKHMEVSIFHVLVGIKKQTKKVDQNQLSSMCLIFKNTSCFVINRNNDTTYWFKITYTRILEHKTN